MDYACENGVILGQCHDKAGPWSHKRVKCGLPIETPKNQSKNNQGVCIVNCKKNKKKKKDSKDDNGERNRNLSKELLNDALSILSADELHRLFKISIKDYGPEDYKSKFQWDDLDQYVYLSVAFNNIHSNAVTGLTVEPDPKFHYINSTMDSINGKENIKYDAKFILMQPEKPQKFYVLPQEAPSEDQIKHVEDLAVAITVSAKVISAVAFVGGVAVYSASFYGC